MNDVEKKRQELIGAYSGKQWREKVIKMSEAQVIAIYMNLKRQNKL